MPSNHIGKIEVTPSMLRKNEATITVHAPEIIVRLNWRVWLGMRLIWLGALIAGMGYKTEANE